MTRLGIGIYAFFIMLFGVLCYFAYKLPYFPGDISISHYLQSIELPLFKPIMQGVSSWVPAGIVTFLLVVALWVLKKRLEAVFIASLTSSAALISWLLKFLISRPRPSGELVQLLSGSWGLSFPSTHATLALVFCGFLFYLAPRLVKPPAVTGVLRFILIALVLLVGISRIYLGVHWASDVVGGLFLGGLILYPAIVLHHNYDAKQGVKNARTP
jgi:membrane-associated phospholipid phosphatase